MRTGAERRADAIAMGIPVLITLAAYLRCLGNGFVYDDNEMVTLNRYIGGWSFIWKSLVNDSWWFRDPLRLPQSSYYRPLQDVWLGINYHLFGLNPAGWHAMMIAVHLIAVALVFALARDLIGSRMGATIAAALFGLMPIHAQAIVWPSAIPLPMSAIFEIAAMLCFIRRAHRPERYLTLALGFFAGALLSHESSIVFPFILMAYAFLLEPTGEDAAEPLRNRMLDRLWRSAIAAAPFFAEVIVYLAIRWWVLGFISRANRTNDMTMVEKLLTVPAVLANYLILLVAPWRAGPAHPVLPANSALAPEFYLPALGLAATLTAVAILVDRSPRRRLYFFCAAWILIPILPVLNLGALSPLALVEDRYLYLPSVAWCIFLAAVTSGLIEAYAQYSRHIAVAVGALAIAYGASLWRVEHYWHDEIALFRGCIEMFPDSTLCHGRLAMAYEGAGNWNGAALELTTAERLHPNDGGTLYNLALLHDRFGAHQQAENEMARAIQLLPDAPVQPYLEMARVADAAGDSAASERALAHAAAMREGPEPALITRAQLKLAHRDYAGADTILKGLAASHPYDLEVWILLGSADLGVGHAADALSDANSAIAISPQSSDSHLMRAVALNNLGERDDALAECGRALALDPRNSRARELAERLAPAVPR